jgi:hypothetical protein
MPIVILSILLILSAFQLRLLALPFDEHAPGEAEVSAQEPTLVGRFYGQTVLQRRVLA